MSRELAFIYDSYFLAFLPLRIKTVNYQLKVRKEYSYDDTSLKNYTLQ